MADWEEIKRLAADFQRAQLSSTVQRLSERNCVEIVQRLIQQNLIDVIYTVDGKEYLTPQELGKEIREELQVRGGRINLVDLSQVLNLDLNHVENKVAEIVKSDRSLTLILGQLIDRQYLDTICEEINDTLQEKGQVSIAGLTKEYNLPGDFLSQSIHERLNSIIQGRVDDFDPNTIFTQAFIDRYQAKIRGQFSAVTRPLSLTNVISTLGIQERLFYSILDELINIKRLAGAISGGRKDKAQYIPDIYTRAQNEWVDSFYKQNGYLEYDSVARLGILDPKMLIKKRLKSEDVLYLSTCCLGNLVRERMEAEVEEALSTIGWVDVTPHLPSILNTNDIDQILQSMLKSKPSLTVLCDTIVVGKDFIDECSKPFDKMMYTKAEQDARTNPLLLVKDDKKGNAQRVGGLDDGGQGKEDKKEQRRKKATTGKSGGGTQGREVKTKSTKKKTRGRDLDVDSDDEAPSAKSTSQDIEFMISEEIQKNLEAQDKMKNCPEEMLEAIALQLYRPLKRQYQDIAKSVFLQQMGSTTGSARKKTHGDLSDKINGLWENIRLFEKGLKLFSDDTQVHMTRHLLKTLCTDVTNIVFNVIAADHMLSVQNEANLTPEVRQKLLGRMPDDETRALLVKLHSSLAEKSVDDFLTQLEAICGTGHLDIMLKKPDKKKERQIVFGHRQALVSQLKEETDPAMVLHLSVTLLFHIFTQCLVHAPGRCVPQMLMFLKEHMAQKDYDALGKCQDLVMLELRQQSDNASGDTQDTAQQLDAVVPQVKEVALSAKKPQSGANNED